MAANYDVFVRATAQPVDLVRDVGAVLGADARPHDNGDGFLLITNDAFVDVYLEHELENDGDLPFSAFPYQITVRDREKNRDRGHHLARRIYSGLIETGRYECFIVYNTMELIARSD